MFINNNEHILKFKFSNRSFLKTKLRHTDLLEYEGALKNGSCRSVYSDKIVTKYY